MKTSKDYTLLLIVLIFGLAALFSFLSCSKKDTIIQPTCKRCLFLSDKYNSDSIYDHTDTLYNGVACGKDLEGIKNYKPIMQNNCYTMTWEFDYYKILK